MVVLDQSAYAFLQEATAAAISAFVVLGTSVMTSLVAYRQTIQ